MIKRISSITGWLEPLLYPIKQNWSRATVPSIKSIDDKKFTFYADGTTNEFIGGFLIKDMTYDWIELTKNAKSHQKLRVDPLL